MASSSRNPSSEHQPRSSRTRRRKTGWIWVSAIAAGALVCGVLFFGNRFSPSRWVSMDGDSADQASEKSGQPTAGAQKSGDSTSSFTFTGVGDNLLHDTIFVYYEQDHNSRDFTPIYEMTVPYFQSADLAYCNFETVCAGDAFGLSGYPAFNGPTEMIDSLMASGFDWFSISSNHSLDATAQGLIYEKEYMREHYPDLSETGAFVSEEDAAAPVVRNINGIRVGLCGFTYGLEGAIPADMPWLVDVYRSGNGPINYELIDQKLDALNAVSDVQIVAMHWGDEYQTSPNAEQIEVANYLNSKGVEVIIGTHPHVIEPVEIIKSPEQETLVYYSLGNFVSAQNTNETMVGGMANFTLSYDFDTHKASFSDIRFTPTITWISPDLREYRTTTIHEYNDDMAANHYITAEGMDISKSWVQSFVDSVMRKPDGIEIVLE